MVRRDQDRDREGDSPWKEVLLLMDYQDPLNSEIQASQGEPRPSHVLCLDTLGVGGAASNSRVTVLRDSPSPHFPTPSHRKKEQGERNTERKLGKEPGCPPAVGTYPCSVQEPA